MIIWVLFSREKQEHTSMFLNWWVTTDECAVCDEQIVMGREETMINANRSTQLAVQSCTVKIVK